MALSPGGMLSHYRLVEKIGEGGMGEVCCVRDSKLGWEVAIFERALCRGTMWDWLQTGHTRARIRFCRSVLSWQ